MRIALLALVAAGMLACTKDRAPVSPSSTGETTTTGANVPPSDGMRKVEHVRAVLREQRPGRQADIDTLVIGEAGGVITLAGDVSDEQAHAEILQTVRSMPGIGEVRDQIRVRNATNPGVVR